MIEERTPEGMNIVDFVVPLSGSELFDMSAHATALNLCARFPGIKTNFDKENRQMRIYGQLSDHWYSQFKAAVFHEVGIDTFD